MFYDAPNEWLNKHISNRPFVKMHAQRNHFVIIDGRINLYRPSVDQVIDLCNPEVGVGGDQVLIIEEPTSIGLQKGADAFMRIFNVDGSEVSTCGNATRCVAYLLMEESKTNSVVIETKAGLLECNRTEEDAVSVNLGHISTHWKDIPLVKEMVTKSIPIESGLLKEPDAFYIGNPHVVFYVDDFDAIDIPKFAPAIQNHPLFPEGVNVGVAQILSPTRMRLAVFERPGMVTYACGSGASVAVFGAQERGLLNSGEIEIEMPGGDLKIQILPNKTALLTAKVSFCCFGYLPNH